MKTKRVDFARTRRSSLQGYVVTTRERLTELFGKPEMGYDSKTSVQWTLEIDGQIITLYDYHTPAEPGEEYEFHIGGYTDDAVQVVQNFLPQAFDWRNR